MFDLNEQISNWRSTLTQSETLDKSDVDELESHLREEVENLTAQSLSEEEAFWVARHRLGEAGSLAGEFSKVNGRRFLWKRLFWMTAGVLLFLVIGYIAGVISNAVVFAASSGGLKGYPLGLLGVIVRSLILFAAVILLYFAFRQDKSGRFARLAGSLPGIILLAAGAASAALFVVLGRFFFPAATARMMGVRQYGQMVLVQAYVDLVWIVLLPIALTVLLLILWALTRARQTT